MFVKALIVSALASAAFATECARTYTVKEGDWCDSISRANNASTYQLSTVNADKINDACTNLEVGQELCLGTTGQDCTYTHNVVAGDSCEKLFQVYSLNATMLYANNPQIDEYCSNIYIGEVLCVDNAYAAPVEVPERQIGQPDGTPAGPPAPTPYPEAKQKAYTPEPPSNNNNNEPAASPAPAAPETEDDDDDSSLPLCEDPDDDGYAY